MLFMKIMENVNTSINQSNSTTIIEDLRIQHRRFGSRFSIRLIPDLHYYKSRDHVNALSGM